MPAATGDGLPECPAGGNSPRMVNGRLIAARVRALIPDLDSESGFVCVSG